MALKTILRMLILSQSRSSLIEAFVEEGEVFNSVSGEDEGEKIIIFNNDDEEVLEVLEVLEILDEKFEEYQEDEEYDIDEDNYNYEFGEDTEDDEIFTKNDEIKKRDEALNRKLNFGNSDSCRVMYKLWKFSCKNVLF